MRSPGSVDSTGTVGFKLRRLRVGKATERGPGLNVAPSVPISNGTGRRRPLPCTADLMASPELIDQESITETLSDSGLEVKNLEESPSALLVVDDTGQIWFANNRAAELFGYDSNDLTGEDVSALVPARLRQKQAVGLESFFLDHVPRILGQDYELIGLRQDGRQFPVEITATPLGNGGLAFCIVRDLTGMSQAEDHLVAKRRKLEELTSKRAAELEKSTRELAERTAELEGQTRAIELIVDSMGEGVVVVDAEVRFKLFNSAARELLGRGPTDKSEREWAEFYGMYRTDRETPLREHQIPLVRALRGEQVDNFQMYVRAPTRADGLFIAVTARPIRITSGDIAGAVAVFRNISEQKRTEAELSDAREELERRVVERTLSLARANRELNIEIEERRQAEVALKASERQLRLMADSLPVLIAYIDSRQRYLFYNASYDEWFGLGGEDVRGKPVWEVVGIERYKLIRPFVEQALSGLTVATEMEFQHPEHGLRQVQMNLVPDRDDSGDVQGFYTVGLDITERHSAEAMERKHREELAHVSRVTTMGELAAALAHELNQPLTSIRSNAQAALRLMQSGQIDEDELSDILTDIITDDRRAAEVIRRLRAMLKKRPITLETLSLNDVIDETVSMVRNDALMRGIAVEVAMDPDMPRVRADRIQLQQVLLNLIMNGFEAMRDTAGGKTLTIRSIRPDGENVCVCVSDLGPGLPGSPDTRDIFRPFYSTKEEGMGMGLSISRSIIEDMGGKIWAVENDGRGVTFHFTLPTAR